MNIKYALLGLVILPLFDQAKEQVGRSGKGAVVPSGKKSA
jgi:hypothetical protein